MGNLVIVTAQTAEPVSVEQQKLHMRVDHDEDDTLIASIISAARQSVEAETGRQLVTQTWDWKRNGFPQEQREPTDYYCPSTNRRHRGFKMPRPPFQSVTSITYLAASDGTSTVLSSSNYSVETAWASGGRVDPRIPHGRIVEAWNCNWPASRDQADSVIVRFVAGYGAAQYVPEEFKAAIRLLAAHWYENREAGLIGTISSEMDVGIQRMMGNLSAGEL